MGKIADFESCLKVTPGRAELIFDVFRALTPVFWAKYWGFEV